MSRDADYKFRKVLDQCWILQQQFDESDDPYTGEKVGHYNDDTMIIVFYGVINM